MLTVLYHALCFFFFNDTATTEIYTLSLHDALPIWRRPDYAAAVLGADLRGRRARHHDSRHDPLHGRGGILRSHLHHGRRDRKSTRLNSSHSQISYAVFCLKKKNTTSRRHASRHGTS